MAELRRWLDDQIEQGLATAGRDGPQPFETMAARLVDAQAPAVAGAVRRLAGIAGVGERWADRLLGEFALLRLLIAGHDRLGTLDPATAATVRGRIGYPTASAEVLSGPRVTDHWQILGQVEADDGPLTSRRTWLLGAGTGRFALILEFAAPGRPLPGGLVPGRGFHGDLCFHPGAAPLRALIAARHPEDAPVGSPVGAGSFRAGLSRWASLITGDPWRYETPMLLSGVVPASGGLLVDGTGCALPLAPGFDRPWWLLAAAGAAPATVAAEWSPAGLRPLAAWVDGEFVPVSAPATGSPPAGRPELPPELLTAALVGTGRRPWSAATLRVGALTIDLGSPSALLEAAAVALVCGRAGVEPESGHVPTAPAPAEVTPVLPAAAGARLALLLGGGAPGGGHQEQELLGQWLRAAAERGGVVPPAILPDLLEAGRRTTSIRAQVALVAGRRGAWLAGQRDDWRWLLAEAAPLPAGDWASATTAERLGHLAALRDTDPARAVELLAGTWDEDSADFRARGLATFATGLSLADEPLLDRALDDRRREVRETALDLLRRLPGAALGERMAARARAAVRLAGGVLVVEPPTDLDSELRRDGVGATPVRGIGTGAWLLEEVVAGTPLATWSGPRPGPDGPAGLGPAGWIGLARAHDWATPLLHGWAKAAVAQHDPDWAAALLDAESATLRESVRWDLHLVLPPGRLARLAAAALRSEDGSAQRLLALHPGPWPDGLSVAVLETVEQRARTDRHTWQLSELCRAAGTAMPPGYADLAGRLAGQLDRTLDPARVRPVAELARTLTFRHEMLEELR